VIAFGIVGVFLGPVLLVVAHTMFQDWNLPETEVRWSAPA
jgi:predicted PurR-regulated permease PerM